MNFILLLTISIRCLTSSLLCLGSTLENTLPCLPSRVFFFQASVILSNSAPVKQHLEMSYSAVMMFSFCAIATAVSLESPVIIITLMPAFLQLTIESQTSGLTGSWMQTQPINERPLSSSSYLLTSDSNSEQFFSVIFFMFPPSVPIAQPRTRQPWDATF